MLIVNAVVATVTVVVVIVVTKKIVWLVNAVKQIAPQKLSAVSAIKNLIQVCVSGNP